MGQITLTVDERGFIEQKINLSGTQTSDIYILPIYQIDKVSVMNSGSASIYFTNYSKNDIINDVAQWDIWNGTDMISNMVTAFYAINISGNSEIMVRISRKVWL